jgi:receptor protein-tyrosine kinase
MNAAPKSRAHLVERAVEAMTGRAPVAPPPAAVPPPAPEGAAVPPPSITPPPIMPAAPPPAAALRSPAPPPAPPPTVPPISVETLGAAGLVVAPVGTSRSRLSEEIAVVQHSVLRTVKTTRSSDGRNARIIMVTSAKPGEGKTFISLNLAASLANSGTRPVVLVDVDGKMFSISRLLGHAESPGIRMLATEPARPAAPLLVPTAVKRLSLLPYGPVPAETPGIPPGQMMTTALLRLAAALPEHLLVLDTPPCLSTSDPGALAPIVGQVLMVVEAERTQKNEVEAALDMVDACPTLQLVLNRAVVTSNDTFGAYGGYDAYAAAADGKADGKPAG